MADLTKLEKTVGRFEKVSLKEYKKECTFDEVEDIHSSILLPRRGTSYSAGYDFYAPHDFVIPAGGSYKVATGIKVYIAEGYYLGISPRSSLGFKHRISLVNTEGIVDGDYYNNEGNEGHIFVKLYNGSDKDVLIKAGDKFCQGIFKEHFYAEDDMPVKEVRVGGIGSTGK